MNSNPVVSVIMPCFNDGKYILDAVNSVINQTYTNWELIVVDDGSDDSETKEVLKSINNEKITIIYNKHSGVVKARNDGIAKAKGDYIVPLDADDIAESSLLEKYIRIIQSDHDIGIVYCLYEYFGMNHGIYKLPDYNIINMLISCCITNTSIFRKKDWALVGGYNSTMELGCEDYDFWLSILELGRKVVLVPEILLHYRDKGNTGRTKKIDVEKEKIISDMIINNHLSLYKDHWLEYIIAERHKIIDLQKQIDELYKEKYKWRIRLYKLPYIYNILHKNRK